MNNAQRIVVVFGLVLVAWAIHGIAFDWHYVPRRDNQASGPHLLISHRIFPVRVDHTVSSLGPLELRTRFLPEAAVALGLLLPGLIIGTAIFLSLGWWPSWLRRWHDQLVSRSVGTEVPQGSSKARSGKAGRGAVAARCVDDGDTSDPTEAQS